MMENYKTLDELINEINLNRSAKFKIKVVQNSKNNSIEFCEEFIKIKIKERAIEGRANKAIIAYFSDLLSIAKTKIKILNGEKSSIKTILVSID